jgi:hypothetical protein
MGAGCYDDLKTVAEYYKWYPKAMDMMVNFGR